ncbi:hypothetical protein VKT23_004894 [Stygiomarasmius scandens]|uniref:Uncharacterized protein n=1 Tax=Marasmiellus scandens TaxID=2682957 RepID=A0ABR1JTL1_9AGAR
MSASQQSLPLSDPDVSVLKDWIAETALSFLLCGVYLTLSTTTIYLFTRRKLLTSQHKSKIILFFLTTLMLFTSLTSIILRAQFAISQVPLLGFNPPDAEDVTPFLTNSVVVTAFLDRFNYVLSDGIVVWRAWILFPRNLTVKIILSICVIGSAAGAFINVGIATKRVLTSGYTDSDSGKFNPLIMTLPLFCTNVIATGLIGCKAWYHRRDIKKNLGSTYSSTSRIQKILLLLVESGIIYCVLWIVYAYIGVSTQSNSSLSFALYAVIMPNLSAIYPTLIVLIAALEHVRTDSSDVHNLSLSQSIRFASLGQLATNTTFTSSQTNGMGPVTVVENRSIEMEELYKCEDASLVLK